MKFIPARILFAIAIISAITCSLVVRAQAQTESVLFIFAGGGSGQYPFGGVALDAKGNVYGTVSSGGDDPCNNDIGCGVLYELSPSSNGWTYSQAWGFTGGVDGNLPLGGAIFDSAGNMYATANMGGIIRDCPLFDNGCGTVDKFSPNSDGSWTETTLLEFTGTGNGSYPLDNVFMDKAGNLYGTTEYGGSHNYCNGATSGCGVVFELSPNGSGGWTQSVLHVFESGTNGVHGYLPWSGVVVDDAGNIYGTTSVGGFLSGCIVGCGVVYKLSPSGAGTWDYSVLYSFKGKSDGSYPIGGVILDAKGNLYGAAEKAGNLNDCSEQGCGTVYELSPESSGNWKFEVLHTFSQADGAGPLGALTFDTKGNLYGTTVVGGDLTCNGGYGCGTVFRMTPSSKGWHLTTLHAFTNSPDGAQPYSGVTLDASGNVFGSTQYGGLTTVCCGIVFEIKP
jgi:hypothetical protein